MPAAHRLIAASGLAIAFGFVAILPPAQGEPSAGAPRPQACFYLNQMQNMRSDGPRTLYVRVSGRHVFRIDLDYNCPGLEDGTNTAVLNAEPSGEVCGPMNLNIAVRETGERCTAHAIVQLTDAEAAALPDKVRP